MSRIKPLSFLLTLFLLIAPLSTAFAAAKTFHANGKLESETFYNQETKEKEKALWYNANGLLQSEEKFTGDNSKVVTFYNDKGQKSTEETIVDGQRLRVRSFHANGNVKLDYTLKDEKLDGKYREYREDGKIAKEIDYKEGKEI
jgi:antitoxin component YwqK of YwqJK toxin-antitoxin module